MFETIAHPSDCKVRSAMRFLNAKNVKPAEIHRQLIEIYGENVMTDGMVRKWVRQFNDGRTNVNDESQSGRPSVVNDGLVAKVNEKISENRRFTIRMLCDEFPQISKTVLHEIVTNRLNYRKLCSRWVPKMFMDVHRTKRFGSALTFRTRYSEEGNGFLNKIVTGGETWVRHVTLESKQQSMEWRHSRSPTKKYPKQRCQHTKSCALCSGTDRAFCFLSSFPEQSQSQPCSSELPIPKPPETSLDHNDSIVPDSRSLVSFKKHSYFVESQFWAIQQSCADPNLPSAISPVPHSSELPIPKPPET
ncbi:hypothetical protein AVEN_107058-1 [Araneus ventricosus]|uniref:Mos1 transposase HTH domain-containing protein n=1 Tax=Araneus ventricosus TaxID=182803 RepID=A0A4Y2JTH1_ARAVE|nr:hypothetical protein AVEN_107058-1 [Araneus ventricosus]